jgi:G-protein alpha subunit
MVGICEQRPLTMFTDNRITINISATCLAVCTCTLHVLLSLCAHSPPSNSPYFDNVDGIIFLAPISCFDERLAENQSINRLEDSMILFRAICGAKCLSRATLILFLNKCDLLEKKLAKGVMVNKHIPSFGERNNDAVTFIKCMSFSSVLYFVLRKRDSVDVSICRFNNTF